MAQQTREKGGSLIKESWNMVVTYVTAALLVFVLTFHLLLHSPLTGKAFEDTLAFGYATGNLVYYQVIFGVLLFAAVVHGINGLRVIVVEWLHPTRLAWLLNVIVIALMAFFIAVGTVTLIVVG
ncbi:MAG TPA: hypothetical protein VLU91_02045 [Nitrososphaerales archaeon]|nr:hypothetical protein [Nitrososphaerales archaeon]